jgi:predicted transcriptional regulator
MDKKCNYQPFIIEEAKKIVELLEQSNFFIDFEIKKTDYALEYFCEKLTQKFIDGESIGDSDLFTENEMDIFLNEIMVGSIISQLQDEGIIDSIENENEEEVFFLTQKGKLVAQEYEKKIK